MDLRPLTVSQLHALYQPSLARDFPPDELMPWPRMEALTQAGQQAAYGLFEGSTLTAYGIFILDPALPAALLNYFAVEPQYRNQGIGSLALAMLRQAAEEQGLRCILFEVESPQAALTPEDAALRQRRIGFYLRCGAQPTGVVSQLFGVDYQIMLLPAGDASVSPMTDGQVAQAMDALYHVVVPKELDQGRSFSDVCQVSLAPAEGGRFPRELGRALTFLMRSRKKFMTESLKEYDFAGAMYMILLHVDRHPGSSQDGIANHMYLDKCTVARRTKKLEELGFLYRETDQADRRQNKLYLTGKGQALAPVIRTRLSQWADQVTAGLSQEEKTTLLLLLTKMTEKKAQ